MLVLVVLAVSYASSMRSYLEQKKQMDGLRASISHSRAAIHDLRREKRRWHDPAYVEQQARRRFGWVLPGETGYRVIGKDGKPLAADATLKEPPRPARASRSLWWQTAWGSVLAAGHPKKSATPEPVHRIGRLGNKQR